MKKTISVIGMLVLLQLIGLVQSCNPCGSDGPFIVNLTSISSNLIRITEKEIIPEFQSSINFPIISYEAYDVSEGFISFDSLGIDLLTDLYSFVPKFDNGNIFNSAFACSPAAHFDVIIDISITSSEDYNQWYQAGDELNDIILVRTNFDTFGTLLSDYNIQTDYSLERDDNMLMTFSMPPSISKSYDFTIVITTDNGDVFTEEIKDLKISI